MCYLQNMLQELKKMANEADLIDGLTLLYDSPNSKEYQKARKRSKLSDKDITNALLMLVGLYKKINKREKSIMTESKKFVSMTLHEQFLEINNVTKDEQHHLYDYFSKNINGKLINALFEMAVGDTVEYMRETLKENNKHTRVFKDKDTYTQYIINYFRESFKRQLKMSIEYNIRNYTNYNHKLYPLGSDINDTTSSF